MRWSRAVREASRGLSPAAESVKLQTDDIAKVNELLRIFEKCFASHTSVYQVMLGAGLIFSTAAFGCSDLISRERLVPVNCRLHLALQGCSAGHDKQQQHIKQHNCVGACAPAMALIMS